MDLINDPNLPTDIQGRYSNRFKVGDIVIAGKDSARCGSKGVIIKKLGSESYKIKWDKEPYTPTWYDYDNWIIPDPKPTITRNELIESYEI